MTAVVQMTRPEAKTESFSPPAQLRAGEDLRVVFVGQTAYFEACALDRDLPGISTAFVDFRSGADECTMLSRVESCSPHVVIMFRPELVPAGLFGCLDAITVGYLTEPIPRGVGSTHPDLKRRLQDLKAIDRDNFDRIISFDPLIQEVAAQAGAKVWRSVPLPVADSYFIEHAPTATGGRAIFTGRSTEHREHCLMPAKHMFDVVHVVHGMWGESFKRLVDDSDIGINIHNEPYLSFENRVPAYLAAGLLVVTEPLSPTHGLEPGIDYVEIRTPDDLLGILDTARRYPDAYLRTRIRGRAKAEYFRASTVYPRLLADIINDVRAFGRGRPVP
jgi:hypothetical protein